MADATPVHPVLPGHNTALVAEAPAASAGSFSLAGLALMVEARLSAPDARLRGMSSSDPAVAKPSWSSPREALRVVGHRPHLRATVRIALVVGTILFVINQLDVVLAGNASTSTWVKGAITYLVPFVVSNLGILTATRQHS